VSGGRRPRTGAGAAACAPDTPSMRRGASLPHAHKVPVSAQAACSARSLAPRSRADSALRMSRREMLGERQVAAPLMAPRAAHGALRPAHRRFQPGEGVGVQLAGLRPGGKPDWPSQCQFGHKTLVLGFALITPAASRPGQHCAMRRQRGRQVAPCGHASTVGQRFPRLVRRDDQCGRPVRSPCPIPPPWPISRGALTKSLAVELGPHGIRVLARVGAC